MSAPSPPLRYRVFKILYWLGVLAAFLIMLGYAPPESPAGRFVPLSLHTTGAGVLLSVSYLHVFALALLGFDLRGSFGAGRQAEPSFFQHAGTLVQTAGYLHTLVGFGAALFVLDPDDLDVIAVLGPIGSALGTSILGWFLGGEIVGRALERGEAEAREQLSDLLSYLDTFAERAVPLHERYLDAVQATAMMQERAGEAQERTFQKAIEGSDAAAKGLDAIQERTDHLTGHIEGLDEQVRSFKQTLDVTLASGDFREAVLGLARAATQASTKLDEAAEDAGALQGHLGTITGHAQQASERLETFAAAAETKHSAYIQTMQQAQAAVKDMAQTFKNALEAVGTAQEHVLQKAAEGSEATARGLNAVQERTGDVTERLAGLDEQVESLERTLHATLASDSFRNALQKLTKASEQTGKKLSQAATHADVLQKRLSDTNGHAQRASKGLETFTSASKDRHEAYTEAVKQAQEAVEKIAKTFEAAIERAEQDATALTEVTDRLEPITQILSDLDDALAELRASIGTVTDAVAKVGESGRDTTTAIEETGVTARRMTGVVRQTRTIIDHMMKEVLADDAARAGDGHPAGSPSAGTSPGTAGGYYDDPATGRPPAP